MRVNKIRFIENKIYLILILLMIGLFFLPLPIPVEDREGAQDKDKFIYGGIYWTSIYEQVIFENYIPLSLFLPFISIGVLVHCRRRRE